MYPAVASSDQRRGTFPGTASKSAGRGACACGRKIFPGEADERDGRIFQRLSYEGCKLFYLKEDFPKLTGVRILRKGLFLGEMKKGRFEPSQPLAAALYPEEYDKYISFDLEDERTIRYLKCETLNVDTDTEGIHLIGTGRFPMGWGKIKKGRMKNKYASSWRWM